MSEPQKEQTPKQAETAKLDSTSAAAALAFAVKSAQKSSGKPGDMGSDKAGAVSRNPQCSSPAALRYAVQAAAIAIIIALGSFAGSHAVSGAKEAPQIVPAWAETALSSIRQNQEDLVRLTGDVRALKNAIDSMKDSVEQRATEAAGRQRALLERVDGIERAAQDTIARVALVTEASGRIERAGTDVGAKIATLSDRLDGIERQAPAPVAAAAKAATAAAPEGPPQTGSVPDPKAALKQVPVEGWVLREVFDGVALVEARNGRLHEVVPGQILPNVGRVEAIERRGRTWVVVTSKGIIGPPERWQ